jgi:hypothetical protein
LPPSLCDAMQCAVFSADDVVVVTTKRAQTAARALTSWLLVLGRLSADSVVAPLRTETYDWLYGQCSATGDVVVTTTADTVVLAIGTRESVAA